jgi:hypothetical protein
MAAKNAAKPIPDIKVEILVYLTYSNGAFISSNFLKVM